MSAADTPPRRLMYVALMRRFAWASPAAIKRLTPRQIHYLFTTVLPGDEKGAPAAPEEASQPPAPPIPERGTRAEYDAFRNLVRGLGGTQEQAIQEWERKRGPVPEEWRVKRGEIPQKG